MAGENQEFLAFVLSLPCRMSMHDPCVGGPTYALRTGAHDETAIPLCGKHRLALVTGGPPFETMGAKGRLRWELEQIDYVRSQWLGLS